MARHLSLTVGPKPKTKLEASIINHEIRNIRIIEQENLESFTEARFDFEFGVVNSLHNLLPTKNIRVGDSWKRPIPKPLTSYGRFPDKADFPIAVITFEKIENTGAENVELATLNVKTQYRKKTARFPIVGNWYETHKDVTILSEGRIVLDISRGVPVSYTMQTEANFVSAGIECKLQEEYKCNFVFTENL